MRLTVITIIAGLLIATTLPVCGLSAKEANLFLAGGQTLDHPTHGHADFLIAHLELAAKSAYVERILPNTDVGASLRYSSIRQPQSWFGNQFGDPDINVNSGTALIFARHYWKARSDSARPYLELAFGPMWSDHRVPAATSRFNFNSELAIGFLLFPNSRTPVHAGYRFSHISNNRLEERNPGWNLNSLYFGFRLWGRQKAESRKQK